MCTQCGLRDCCWQMALTLLQLQQLRLQVRCRLGACRRCTICSLDVRCLSVSHGPQITTSSACPAL